MLFRFIHTNLDLTYVLQLNGVPNDIINNINPISLIVSALKGSAESMLKSCSTDLHPHLRSWALSLPSTKGNPILPFEEDYCWFLLRYLGDDLVRLVSFQNGHELILSYYRATVTQLYIYRMSPCGYYANTCTDADGNVSYLGRDAGHAAH